MKQSLGYGVAGGLLAAALFSGAAYAHGFGHRHGSLIPPIVGRMVSHDQIRAIFEADKANLHNLHAQVRTAREQLENDLVAGNNTAADLQALETAQNNLLAERVKLAQQILATLSPTQRSQVLQFMTQWKSLRAQERQLFQQYGGSAEAGE
jgi:Spy/CpxP family protein refolding chaperone